MKKEHEILPLDRPEAAVTSQGLTDAERQQMSLDYGAYPDAFEQLQVFCGLSIYERRHLKAELGSRDALEEEIAANKEAYGSVYSALSEAKDRSWPMLSGGSRTQVHEPHVLRAAHSAAGELMRDFKDRLRDHHSELDKLEDALSVTLAWFCQENMSGEPLIILGRLFDYSEGYLTTKLNPQTTVIFGSFERLVDCNKKEISKVSNHEAKKLQFTHASHQDWQNLLAALDLVAAY